MTRSRNAGLLNCEIVSPTGAVLNPAREQTAPRMLHRRVRILIGGDIQTFAPRFFDLFDHFAHPPPVALGAHF